MRAPGTYDIFYAERFNEVWRTLYVPDYRISAKGATQLLAAASAAMAAVTLF